MDGPFLIEQKFYMTFKILDFVCLIVFKLYKAGTF